MSDKYRDTGKGVRHAVPTGNKPTGPKRKARAKQVLDLRDPDVMTHIDAVLRITKRRGEQ